MLCSEVEKDPNEYHALPWNINKYIQCPHKHTYTHIHASINRSASLCNQQGIVFRVIADGSELEMCEKPGKGLPGLRRLTWEMRLINIHFVLVEYLNCVSLKSYFKKFTLNISQTLCATLAAFPAFPLNVLRRSSCLPTTCGYLGLDDGLGAGLQHGEMVGEHQELQLLCLQHHLNVVLHSSRLATHRYRNRHRWKRATESITGRPHTEESARSVKKSINHRGILSVWSILYWMPGIQTLKERAHRVTGAHLSARR